VWILRPGRSRGRAGARRSGGVGGAGVSSAPLQPDNDEEDSKPRPLESKAVARREAMESWLRFGDEAGVCVHVFHLGGIYGPGRSKVHGVCWSCFNAGEGRTW
jgi:hypothetical protein